jgi:hypothetical protein
VAQSSFDPYFDVFVKLPPEGQHKLAEILTSNDPMAPGVAKLLLGVLNNYKPILDTLGLLPEYYAYALVYWASRQSPQALQKLRKPKPPTARDMFGHN